MTDSRPGALIPPPAGHEGARGSGPPAGPARELLDGRDWTADEIAELARLWGLGLSGTEIGRRLARTKSAIIGKANRLHLSARASPLIRSHTPGAAKMRRLRASAKELPAAADAAEGRAQVARASVASSQPAAADSGPPPPLCAHATCQWIEDEPEGVATRFCGRPARMVCTREGKWKPTAWCPDHYARVYVRPRPHNPHNVRWFEAAERNAGRPQAGFNQG